MDRKHTGQFVSIVLAGTILIMTGLFLIIDDLFLHLIEYTGYGGPIGPWFFSHDIYGVIMVVVGLALIISMSGLLKKGIR